MDHFVSTPRCSEWLVAVTRRRKELLEGAIGQQDKNGSSHTQTQCVETQKVPCTTSVMGKVVSARLWVSSVKALKDILLK